ncbi:MAG: glycosyltransferase [Candidatus Bathyarchaeia archaeon]
MDKVSIIIPTYNERDNVSALLPRISRVMGDRSHEIVIVDDHSPDGTWKVAMEHKSRYPNLKVVLREERGGIGGAIKDGFAASDGDLIVTMDADFSHDPRSIIRFLEAMERTNAAVVVGSRFTQGGRIEGRNWFRNAISQTASKVTHMMLGLETRDVTSGFRLYRRDVLEKVLPKTKCIKFDFQLEVLSRIQEKVVEVPIVFKKERKEEELEFEAPKPILSRIRHKIVEVPIVFRERSRGRSKFNLSELSSFLTAVWALFLERQGARFSKFVAVSLSGVFVNLAILGFLMEFVKGWYIETLATTWLFKELGPVWVIPNIITPYDLVSVLIAIEVSIVYNFIGNDVWTFADLAGPGRLSRAIKFNVISLLGVALTIGVYFLLRGFYGIHYLLADFVGILCAQLWIFVMSLNWAWMSQTKV